MAKTRKRYVDVPVIDVITTLFAALNTILLAFFICLNAIGVTDPAKARIALGSLIGTFGGVPGGAHETRAPEGIGGPADQPTPQEIEGVRREIADLIASSQAQGDVDVFTRGEDLVFRVEGRALFVENSADLLPQAPTVLAGLAARLVRGDQMVQVEGHVDIASTGQTPYDTPWGYAGARAASICQALVRLGLPAERVCATSAGASRPYLPSETEHQRSLNRRVEIACLGGAGDPRLYPTRHSVTIGNIEIELDTPASPEGSN